VVPRLAKHRDQKIGASVDHLGMIGEIRLGMDHAQELDHRLDPAELSQRRLGDGEQIESGQARFRVGVLNRDVPPEASRPVGAVGTPRGTVTRTGVNS
jgi:hypothetical protein